MTHGIDIFYLPNPCLRGHHSAGIAHSPSVRREERGEHEEPRLRGAHPPRHGRQPQRWRGAAIWPPVQGRTGRHRRKCCDAHGTMGAPGPRGPALRCGHSLGSRVRAHTSCSALLVSQLVSTGSRAEGNLMKVWTTHSTSRTGAPRPVPPAQRWFAGVTGRGVGAPAPQDSSVSDCALGLLSVGKNPAHRRASANSGFLGGGRGKTPAPPPQAGWH